MSVVKLLSRIVAGEGKDDDGAALHDHTFGITSDPLTHFACVFSALIHDLDHPGVPNAQLVKEGTDLAVAYNQQSIAGEDIDGFTGIMEYTVPNTNVALARHYFFLP